MNVLAAQSDNLNAQQRQVQEEREENERRHREKLEREEYIRFLTQGTKHVSNASTKADQVIKHPLGA